MEKIKLTRRNLLKSTAIAGSGLVVGFYLPPFSKALAQAAAPVNPALNPPPNAFVQIAPDNSVTIVINKLEMGQGVNTSLAQLIAEELEVDFTKIHSVSAGVNPVYNSTFMPMQMTGGSSSLSSSWDQHRKIGAGMREMLRSAAAAKWRVPVGEIKAMNGELVHAKKGKMSYGEVANDAAKLPWPESVELKDSKDFKIIGKSKARLDAPAKSNGTAIFGIDVRIPGMLYAVVARPPTPTAKLDKYDASAAKKIKGVVDVVKFGESVAVLAKNTHVATKGRTALNAQWKDKVNGKFSSDATMKAYKEKAKDKGKVADNRGDVEKAGANAAQTLVAEFEFPYLAHACMEPMNCTIHFDGKTCEMWSGHQMPGWDQGAAAKVLGIAPDKIKVNTTYAGGSFGRRGSKDCDYAIEAAQLAKLVKKPLKIVWTREDDMRGAHYRPMNFHRAELKFDANKKLLSFDHHLVGQSIVAGTPFEGNSAKTGLEAQMTEGIPQTKYDFTNFRSRLTREISPLVVQWWRSVGHTHTAYVIETLVDEIAEISNIDPMVLRKELLKKSPRHMAVLNLLTKETKWGKSKVPKGRAWGLAIHESFNSVVGQVAEVSMVDGKPKVHKIWAAVDCGTVVNPEVARTQIESGIVYGLSAAFYQKINVVDGKVIEGNFHQFNVMHMSETPEIQVAFTDNAGSPTGLGEPGLPPAAPAVANAIYRLTKKRHRSLPFA